VRTALAVMACSAALSAFAQQPVAANKEQTLRAAIQSNTGGKINVTAILSTPVPGIYAVQSDGEVFYTDETGRYSFVNASLIDTKERKDLTAALDEQVNKIDFKTLPLSLAIKEVHGNGKRTLAVFEDPNCPICKVFSKFLSQVPDVTVYHFMYPVISPESMGLASTAWCSSDRNKTWEAIMNGARPQKDTGCDVTGLKQILAFGAKYRILETPTMVLADGRRLVGAVPPEQFMAALDASVR
jgi:thiol:disulfide interchange protein DsbC